MSGNGGTGGRGIVSSGDGGEGGAGGDWSSQFCPNTQFELSGKGGDGAKGGNGGAGGSGGNGVRKIILQKKSEEENSITVEKKLPTNEENLLGLGRVKSYRQKKETIFPKLPITDFLI